MDLASSVCEACGARKPTHRVEFRQNVGLVLLRLSKTVEGRLCPDCIEKNFWSMTLVTLVAGWWGVISLFLTPIFLIINFVSYLGAVWALARHERAAGSREPFGSTSLALGVVTLPVMGICGMASLVGLTLGIIGLVSRKPDGGSRTPALLGIGCNALPLLLVAAVTLGALGSTRAPSPGGRSRSVSSQSMGAPQFDAANRQIQTYENGKTAYGNTPAAVELAEKFSVVVKTMTRIAFTNPQKDETEIMTGGHVLAYVEVRADTICFLAHVPNLRNYRGEVRKSLLDLAWAAARASSRRAVPDRDMKLAVALRGTLLYGAIAVGSTSREKPDSSEFEGAVSTSPLDLFFSGAPYAPQPAAPSSSPAPTD